MGMKKLLDSMMVLIMAFLGGCSKQPPKAAIAVVKALKKLEARTQVGISYRDYAPALGEAKAEVNLFLESPEATKMPELAASISKAMNHYEIALKVWRRRIETVDLIRMRADVPLYREVMQEFSPFLEQYPAVNRPDTEGGAIVTLDRSGEQEKNLSLGKLRSIIWNEASEELGRATSILLQYGWRIS